MSEQAFNTDYGPILHNLTPDRVAFCYRQDDADSLSIAQYYREKRKLPIENLIPLPCSDQHTISETEFYNQIYYPLELALTQLNNIESSSSSGHKKIWALILGYNVPNIYITEGNQIAVASRLHRLGKSPEKRVNVKYDRSIFKYFDGDDAAQLYITSVLDGRNADTVKRLIDRSIDVDSQIFVTGAFYIDPYGNNETDAQQEYEERLIEFVDDEIDALGLPVIKTKENKQYDALVNKLETDSFYWGWFVPRYSQNLFSNHNYRRVFLYNADNDSAANIREDFNEYGSDPWCNLAINIERCYATTAGTIDTPGEDAYLRPRPFFRALHRGTSIGEAFIHASPYVNWKLILVGDPLMVVNFPDDVPLEPADPFYGSNSGWDSPGIIPIGSTITLENNQSLYLIKTQIENAISYGLRQSKILNETLDSVVVSHDFSEVLSLLVPINSLKNQKDEETQKKLYIPLVVAWTNFLTNSTNGTVSVWLDNIGDLISPTLGDLVETNTSQIIRDDQIMPVGYWSFTFSYTAKAYAIEDIYFVLQISDDDFATTTKEINSLDSSAGWSYEYRPNVFVGIDIIDATAGFPGRFSGRRIKFATIGDEYSTELDYLTPLDVFAVRWKAIDNQGNTVTDFVNSTRKLIIPG